MKKLFLYILLLALANRGFGQKPLINDTTYKTWTTVINGSLSNDGKFASYIVENKPFGGNTFVVTATDKTWQFESSSYSNPAFSNGGKYLFAIKGVDTLVCLNLKTKKNKFIPHCQHYELYQKDKEEYLIYRINNSTNELCIQNLKTDKTLVIPNTIDYFINRAGFAIITKLKTDPNFPEVLQWTDLSSGNAKVIYKGKETNNQIFDLTGEKIAFTTGDNNYTHIWIYRKDDISAREIANDSSDGIIQNYKISLDEYWKFTSDGESLFFSQSQKKDNQELLDPIIWNYQDGYLRSDYDNNKDGILAGLNLSIVDINVGKIRRLLDGSKKIKGGIPDLDNDLLLVESYFARPTDVYWNKYANFTYYLCNVKTGILKEIKVNSTFPIDKMVLSPDHSFLVYYDPESKEYKGVDTRSNKSSVLNKEFNKNLYTYSFPDRGVNKDNLVPGGVLGWVADHRHIIIQGTFDIWEMDLEGKEKPINLTQFGNRSEDIIFSFLNSADRLFVSAKKEILLSGFNTKDKNYGIYTLNIKDRNLKLMYLSNNYLGGPLETISSTLFQKSAYSNAFMLAEVNANKSLNYLYTNDFKNFTALSDNHPEKIYNWITSQLLIYKDGNGSICEGILYKPENFDAHKKYPIIFSCYLDQSNFLNRYNSPEPSNTGLNIPLLVSNGYLIFKPNIYRIQGQPGQAALYNVMTAVDYMTGFEWVDSSKMAIAGHSFGGFETNFILTKTNRFRAALVCAGPSNLIDNYNELWASGSSRQSYVKNGSYYMGEDLTQASDKYVSNSPILYAGNIHTPILLLHNQGDNAVPIIQSLNLFVQLRSLQKPVWLIQYKDEGHTIVNEEKQIDFQDKVKSYFDYYLMDQEIPKWMLKHIAPPNN